jgi:hypothetical protein
MNAIDARQTLRRLFDAVMREAEQNPRLAQSLAEAIGGNAGAIVRSRTCAARNIFDPRQLHAVNTLRAHGEAALRGRLEQIKAVEDLKSVARASGLVLAGRAGKMRPARADLIAGIVEAAKHYEAQRNAATA